MKSNLSSFVSASNCCIMKLPLACLGSNSLPNSLLRTPASLRGREDRDISVEGQANSAQFDPTNKHAVVNQCLGDK